MFFSIITATYNAAATISSSIQSLQSQTFTDYEHIIVDGKSTDSTLTQVEEYKDTKTTVVSEPDNGMYDALNKGISLARGKVIGFLHADDMYRSEKVLQRVHDTFQQRQTDAVYGDLEYVLKDNPEKVLRRWRSEPYRPEALNKGWMPPHPAFFVKKSMYDSYGSFDTSMHISADYELMMRFLAKHQINMAYLPMVLVQMKTGGASNKSIRNILIKSYEDYKAMRRYNVGGFTTLMMKNFSKIKQFF